MFQVSSKSSVSFFADQFLAVLTLMLSFFGADEIIVNAADNYQRDKRMTKIKVTIDSKHNRITVWNNGKGIPIVMH